MVSRIPQKNYCCICNKVWKLSISSRDYLITWLGKRI